MALGPADFILSTSFNYQQPSRAREAGFLNLFSLHLNTMYYEIYTMELTTQDKHFVNGLNST